MPPLRTPDATTNLDDDTQNKNHKNHHTNDNQFQLDRNGDNNQVHNNSLSHNICNGYDINNATIGNHKGSIDDEYNKSDLRKDWNNNISNISLTLMTIGIRNLLVRLGEYVRKLYDFEIFGYFGVIIDDVFSPSSSSDSSS